MAIDPKEIERIRKLLDLYNYSGGSGTLVGKELTVKRLAEIVVEQADQLAERRSGVASEIFNELERATEKFPTWPTDPLHALAVLSEEYGELAKEMLQFVYEPHKTSREEIHKEAIQTAAMAIRLAMSLPAYDYRPGPQHTQRSEDGEAL